MQIKVNDEHREKVQEARHRDEHSRLNERASPANRFGAESFPMLVRAGASYNLKPENDVYITRGQLEQELGLTSSHRYQPSTFRGSMPYQEPQKQPQLDCGDSLSPEEIGAGRRIRYGLG